MSNFLLGIKSLLHAAKITLVAMLHNPFVWGFGFGFLIASLVYAFIVTRDPRFIPCILVHGPAQAFEKIGARTPEGTYLQSFMEFKTVYNKVRLAFLAAALIFLFLILFALLSF